jgi:hypothetical protein
MKTQKQNATKHLEAGKAIEKKAPLLTYNLTQVQISHVSMSSGGSTPPPSTLSL